VFVQLAGGSLVFQIGVQGTDLIILANDDPWSAGHAENKSRLARCGRLGRSRWTHMLRRARTGDEAELLTHSRSKGLFAGIDLDGSVLSQNSDSA